MANQAILTDFISAHPALESLDSAGRTYLFSNATLRTFKKGDILFKTGEASCGFFYIAKGSVSLENSYGKKVKTTGDFIGGDHLFSSAPYQNTATFEEDTVLITFEAAFMDKFVDDHPKILPGLMRSTTKNTTKKQITSDASTPNYYDFLGYFVTLLSPLVTFHIMGGTFVEPAITLFMCILTATVSMWFFRLFPSYVLAIFFLLAILVLGLAPPQVVLDGFSTKTFVILLSTFTIGSAILTSGLGHRFMLVFFSKFSKSYSQSSFALFFAGLALTPFMPAILARAEIAAPMLLEANKVLALKKGSKITTHLALTLFFGITLLSNVVLSGSLLNYMVLALLPKYMQLHFSWSLWIQCSVVYGAIVIIGFLVASRSYLKTTKNATIDRSILSDQLKVLGPLRTNERLVYISTLIFIVGVITVPFHKIDTAWIAFYVMFFLLFFGVLSAKEFRSNVDWTFLIVISTTIGISSVIKFLGVDLFLYKGFTNLIQTDDLSTERLMFITGIFTFLVRLFLPLGPSAVVAATLLIPLSIHHHIHPWVIAFTILIMCDVWFLKHQSPTYNLFKAQTKISSQVLYDESSFLKFNYLMNGIKIIGLIASIPLWKSMGMM